MFTVRYGLEFKYRFKTLLKTRPLVREGAPQKQDRKFQIATFRQEVIYGRKSHNGARYQDILTDRQS
jgi:hypothetical protein